MKTKQRRVIELLIEETYNEESNYILRKIFTKEGVLVAVYDSEMQTFTENDLKDFNSSGQSFDEWILKKGERYVNDTYQIRGALSPIHKLLHSDNYTV